MLPLMSFFDELEKVGGVFGVLAGQAVKYPGNVMWRVHQIDKGMGAHRQAKADLERGVPAGWASLGMRPRNVG